MALAKAQIIESIRSQTGFSKNKSFEIVETLLETIKKSLASGDDFLISGFGRFCVNAKRERRGRNPATGTDMLLPARRVVTFKWSHALRDKVNGNK